VGIHQDQRWYPLFVHGNWDQNETMEKQKCKTKT
jgi:hypothetical protein